MVDEKDREDEEKENNAEEVKNIGKMLEIFYKTFSNIKNPPALLLKTNGASYSILDKEVTLNRINEVKSQFPKIIKLQNIYLLHGSISPT